MPKTYELADKATHAYVKAVMAKHHKRLVDAKITFAVMLCRGGLKLHGYLCAATVKINSLKDRAEGKADCTITLNDDGEGGFMARPEQEREAIIDHEFVHLLPTGEEDDAGRPALKMRLHDFDLGGFGEVIERHREAALEARALENAHKEWIQPELFKW